MKKVNYFVLFMLIISLSVHAGRNAEDEFWSDEDNRSKGESQGITAFPGESFVQAGLMGYANYGKGKDEFTAGLKISSSFRDYFDYMFFRLDGFLGIGGPGEGATEVQFPLISGFNAGLGINYSKRLKLSPRFGLYVEDKNNLSRRAGFYLLEDSSGGVEVNWPFNDQWDISVDLGVEKTNEDTYKRFIAGFLYKF